MQKGRGPGGLYRTAMNMYGQSITSAPFFCGLFSNGDIAMMLSSHRATTHDSQLGHWSRALL